MTHEALLALAEKLEEFGADMLDECHAAVPMGDAWTSIVEANGIMQHAAATLHALAVLPSGDLPTQIEWMEFARDSHLKWAEHLEAHAASGEPCPQCEARPYKIDAPTEREWVRRYDVVLSTLRALTAPASVGHHGHSPTCGAVAICDDNCTCALSDEERLGEQVFEALAAHRDEDKLSPPSAGAGAQEEKAACTCPKFGCKVHCYTESPPPPDTLVEAAEYVVKRFKQDEAAGYRSRDRKFAIEILEAALTRLRATTPTGETR